MKKKIKIVADKNIPFLKGALQPYAEIIFSEPKNINNYSVKDADALLIRTRTKCNSELLKNSNVKFIATATIGYDHIDTKYCAENGIKWTNAPGCNSSSVQQYMASAILTYANRKKIDLKELTIGIVGAGNVGKKAAKLADIFGMKALLNDPPRERAEGKLKFVPLEEIIQKADIITFHVPLNLEGTDKTFHLADEKFFNEVKNSAIVINTSRGPVVDNKALKEVLKRKKIEAAILDVWEDEPEIDLELLEMVEFGTPHIAGYSSDGKANGTAAAVNAVNDFFNLGLPKKWYPEIPKAENSKAIIIDCESKSDREIIYEAVTHTYKIAEDDHRLKKTPFDFEKLRNVYRTRREFPYYIIKLKNCGEEIRSKFKYLGFKIIQT